MFLVVADSHSKWLEILDMNNTTIGSTAIGLAAIIIYWKRTPSIGGFGQQTPSHIGGF